MFEIQKTKRVHALCGLSDSGVEIIPDILCVRKYMKPEHSEWKTFRNADPSNLFAFVSHPKMSPQQVDILNGVKFWCHPFKKRHKHLTDESSKYILMPESDFMDAAFVDKMSNKVVHDFFYFTVNSKQGVDYKGLETFIDMLPLLCGKMRKKGLVVVYYPSVGIRRKFDCLKNKYQRTLKLFSKNLTFVWGWQNKDRMASLMSSCRFGIFPNEADCSPRLIPESILRDRPVLVNKNIYGGWHYINDNTGSFFTPGNKPSIINSIDQVSNMTSKGRDFFMSNYGFKRSSERLRNFLVESGFRVEKYKHVYFSCYKSIMKELCT